MDSSNNKKIVLDFYEALNSQDVATVQRLLAPDLEWWFHGPPSQQHLMRLLTGRASSVDDSFVFKPLSTVAFGSLVLVEGYDDRKSVSWVHAWTISDGIITQVKEYFNTFVTVTRFLKSNIESKVSSPSAKPKCQSVWQSKLADNTSVPGLVLAL